MLIINLNLAGGGMTSILGVMAGALLSLAMGSGGTRDAGGFDPEGPRRRASAPADPGRTPKRNPAPGHPGEATTLSHHDAATWRGDHVILDDRGGPRTWPDSGGGILSTEDES